MWTRASCRVAERSSLRTSRKSQRHPLRRVAQVYKGKWRNLDVAVKTVLFSEANGSTEQRALREAAVCSSIVHPNVVSLQLTMRGGPTL